MMIGAIVRRNSGYDVILLNEEREVVDIIEVMDVEIHNSIDDFERTLKRRKKYFAVSEENTAGLGKNGRQSMVI